MGVRCVKGGRKSSAVCTFCEADLIKPRLQRTKWAFNTCQVAEAGWGGMIQEIATRGAPFYVGPFFFFFFFRNSKIVSILSKGFVKLTCCQVGERLTSREFGGSCCD